MSHLNLVDLKKSINFIRKYSDVPICIDTEGAQIRTKINKKKILKLGEKVSITNEKKFSLYPKNVHKQLRLNDILNIGFDNLKIKIIKKNKNIIGKVISSGKLENNKGVHLENRKINLEYLTKKDFSAIEIGKKLNIEHYALSFTNSVNDIKKFNKILKNKYKIFKIETLNACQNFKDILKYGNHFLIDRGDLSKYVKIENIPIVQRDLFKFKEKYINKEIFVATNLLESMLENNFPTRGEANDIFNSLEMGSKGMVLAAETAIGRNPISSVKFLKNMIKVFKNSKYKKSKYF